MKCVSAQGIRGTPVLFGISTTEESSFCFAGVCSCLYEEFTNMPRISACVFSCLVMSGCSYAGPLIFSYQDGLSYVTIQY